MNAHEICICIDVPKPHLRPNRLTAGILCVRNAFFLFSKHGSFYRHTYLYVLCCVLLHIERSSKPTLSEQTLWTNVEWEVVWHRVHRYTHFNDLYVLFGVESVVLYISRYPSFGVPSGGFTIMKNDTPQKSGLGEGTDLESSLCCPILSYCGA